MTRIAILLGVAALPLLLLAVIVLIGVLLTRQDARAERTRCALVTRPDIREGAPHA